jgi:voltage-gated potassium channel
VARDNRGMYGQRLQRWEHAVEWPLTAAAIAFFIAYAAEILARPEGAIAVLAEVVIWVTWSVFLIDYVVRLVITEHRWRWFFRHLLDLAIVVLPMLRPLRLMRFLTIIALIQRGAGGLFLGRVVLYTIGSTILIIVIAGLAMYDAEYGQHGNIDSFGNAIWWAFETITTVGYGDFYPVSIQGRIIAVGVMIGGIALIGLVTATLASWIVERVSGVTSRTATETQVDELRKEIAELKEMIAELRPI